MSNVEMQEGGVKVPTWVVSLLGVIFLGWMSWQSVMIIATNNELVELRAQVKSTAVPEGTEKALQEIRTRMNAESGTSSALVKTATENAMNIAYLSRELSELKTQLRKSP